MNTTATISEPRAAAALNQLEQLRQWTTVVADTGDFATLRQFAPQDATTNPTLILKAAQKSEYAPVVERAVAEARASGLSGERLIEEARMRLLVAFGVEILRIIPGRVSTETDASLSFDPAGIVAQARRFIELYRQQGIGRERVLIKIASTWEGIRACEALEREGIHCNMTLLFSLVQAAACAEAGVKLISPFVGRILDWYRKNTGRDYAPAEDPGVLSVREIYTYYKKFGYPTEIMGASFRNKGEILELAGCDLLTISPQLLAELQADTEPITRKLSPETARSAPIKRLELDEKRFRWLLNENAMATEKTAEGIRLFHADAQKLNALIAARL